MLFDRFIPRWDARNFKPDKNFPVLVSEENLPISQLRDELARRCNIINRTAVSALLIAILFGTLAIGLNNFDPSTTHVMMGGPTVTAQVLEVFPEGMEQFLHQAKQKPEPHLIYNWQPFLIVMISFVSYAVGFCFARYFSVPPRAAIPVAVVASWIIFLPLSSSEHQAVKWSDISIEQFDTLDAMRLQPKNSSALSPLVASDPVHYNDQQYLTALETLDRNLSMDMSSTRRANGLKVRDVDLVTLHNRDEPVRPELGKKESELPRNSNFLNELVPIREATNQTNANLSDVGCPTTDTHGMYWIRQKIDGDCGLVVYLNRMYPDHADMMRFVFAQWAYYNDDPATVGYYLAGMTGDISELMSKKAWTELSHEYRLRFSVLADYARSHNSSLDLTTAEEIAAGSFEFQVRRLLRSITLFFAVLAAVTATLLWSNWYRRKQTLESLTNRLSSAH